MSDRRIVERLREWPLSEKLALEAADRIEALEATLRCYVAAVKTHAERIEALEAALREIAGVATWTHADVAAVSMQAIARAALAPEPWPQDAIDQEMIERTDDGWSHPPAEQDK